MAGTPPPGWDQGQVLKAPPPGWDQSKPVPPVAAQATPAPATPKTAAPPQQPPKTAAPQPQDATQRANAAYAGMSKPGDWVPVKPDPQHAMQKQPLDALFNTLDAPFFFMDAYYKGGWPEMEKVHTLLQAGRVNEVAEHYNVMSPDVLKLEAQRGDPFAGWILTHPAAAGIGQFFAEFGNPAQLATGEIVGGVGKALTKGLEATPAGRSFANAFSPLREIAAAGGRVGKRAMQGMLVRFAAAPAEVRSKVLEIFGGLSPEEMDAVVHLYQGSQGGLQRVANMKSLTKVRADILRARVQILRSFMDKITEGKKALDLITDQAAGANRQTELLRPNQEPRHFPLSTAFERKFPEKQEQVHEYLSHISKGGAGTSASPVTKTVTEDTHAAHHTLDEAMTSWEKGTEMGLNYRRNPDWNPAVALDNFAIRSLRNINLETSFKQLPPTVIRPIVAADFQQFAKMANVSLPHQRLTGSALKDLEKRAIDGFQMERPIDTTGKMMVLYNELPADLRNLLEDSPTLEHSWISQSFVNYLRKNSSRMYRDVKIEPKNPVLNLALKAWDGYNNTMRTAIIANPLVHPAWNLANNAWGAGLPFHKVAGLVTRSVIGAIPYAGPKVAERFMGNVAQYQKDLAEAVSAGAVAEMQAGGKEATRRLAARWGDLNAADKVLKAADNFKAWNSRATFGRYGEEAFSAALYKKINQRLLKQGMKPDEAATEAAGQVREALGNYQNVAHDAVGDWQNRVIFFYPWLKGNMPFWVRTLGEKPQAIAAPHQAIRANNLLVGDPTEHDKQHPQYAKDFQIVVGDKEHGFTTVTPILPQRMLTDVASIATSDLTTIINNAAKIARSRLQPTFAVGAEMYDTASQDARGVLDPRNWDTMFDKHAPKEEQSKQLMTNIGLELAPIPVVKNIVRQMMLRGMTPEEIKREAISSGMGIFSYERLTKAQQHGLQHARGLFEANLKKLSPTLDAGKRQERITRIYKVYEQTVNNFLSPKKKGASVQTVSPAP